MTKLSEAHSNDLRALMFSRVTVRMLRNMATLLTIAQNLLPRQNFY